MTGPGITFANDRAVWLYEKAWNMVSLVVREGQVIQVAPSDFRTIADISIWNGFGQNASNTRFQSAPGAGLSAADVPKLKLKWAFGLPGDVQSWAGITLAGGRLFFGSIQGNVYSLDAKTGCVHWAYDAGAIVRTAISIGPLGTTGRFGAFFGDARGNAYALDAATGALVWKVAAETYPSARLTGSPILEGVAAFLDCRVTARYPAGDHIIFIGEVMALGVDASVEPLLFHHGRYRRVGADEPL